MNGGSDAAWSPFCAVCFSGGLDMNRSHRMYVPVVVAVLLIGVGCRRDRELTQMQVDVTEAAGELVVQDAAARREIIQMQAALDAERRLLNERERQDPIIAAAILQVGGLLLCLLPLVVIARLLASSQPEGEALNALVIDELLIEQPPEPEPQRLAHQDLDSLLRDRIADRDP
jgi:hypothetical protein